MEQTIDLPVELVLPQAQENLNSVDGDGFFLEYEYLFLLVREAAACQAYEEEKGSAIAQVEAWKMAVGYGAYGQVGYDRTGYQFSHSSSQRARGYLRQLIPDISYIDVQALSHLKHEDKEKPYKPCVPAVVIQLMTPADQIEDLQAKVACFVDAGTREGVIIDTRREQVWIYNRNQRPYFAPLARIEFDSWPGFTLDCLAIRDARLRTA